MGLLKNFQVFRERVRKTLLGRFENLTNYVHALSWLNIAIVLNLFFGAIFLCAGLILLTGREENQIAGWVFFAISLCMLLLGLFLLIIRCMFPTKSPLPTRHHHPRRRPRRPNQIYDGGRPRSQPNVRSAPQPSPATVWTTPASDLESRTLANFIAQMNFENAQRSPVTQTAPPPTYEQAIGRPNSSTVQTSGETTAPPDNLLPPPYQAAQ